MLLFAKEVFDIIGAAMEVHRTLGHGFLEPVYQESLAIEFKNRNIPFEREKRLKINYKGHELNQYYKADFVCHDKIIVELKALSELCSEHDAQILNYLKATGLRLGILINFGTCSLEYKRLIK